MEVRSYRAVFDLERRIYRVDRLRLNPGGVPVRGIVYCLAILACLALAGTLPLLGAAVRALPWYVRDLLLPAGSAALLTMIRVEGRPFHVAAAALLRHLLGPRQLIGLTAASVLGSRQLVGLTAASVLGPRQLIGMNTAFRGGAFDPALRAGRPRAVGAPVGVWRPEELLVLPDGSDACPRRLRYTGPGAVRVTASKQVVVLERGAELRVR
jgi:hypothetical protein